MVQTNKLLNEHEVNNLFSRVAPRYDLLNNVISLGTQKIWRHEIFNQLQIKPTDNALDVCCGTGDLAIAIAKRISAGRVTGLDFNKEMLEIAKEKTKMIGNLFLVQGDAMALPFDDNSFDIVTIGFGLRNVPDADKALSEIYRDYQYLKETSQQFVSAHQLARMMKAVGFKEVHYQPLNFGAAALHFGDK